MPLTGDSRPRADRWTIRVEFSSSLFVQSLFWPTLQQRAWHEVAAGVAFHVVNAIQQGALRRRRVILFPLPQGDVSFFLRQIPDEHNAIRVTIFEIRFNGPDPDEDPDPNGGMPAPHPFDPLVLDISGCVKGVLPLSRRTNRRSRLKLVFTPFDVRVTAYGVNGLAGYSVAQLCRTMRIQTDYENFMRAAREKASRKGTPQKRASWKMDKLFPSSKSIYINSALSFIGDISRGTKKLAVNPNIHANITARIPIYADARYGLSLQRLALFNASRIRTRNIYPSGSP
jgi:hypothetical protein